MATKKMITKKLTKVVAKAPTKKAVIKKPIAKPTKAISNKKLVKDTKPSSKKTSSFGFIKIISFSTFKKDVIGFYPLGDSTPRNGFQRSHAKGASRLRSSLVCANNGLENDSLSANEAARGQELPQADRRQADRARWNQDAHFL